MELKLHNLMTQLHDSVRRLIAPTATPGMVVDELCNFNLPARSDLGVEFRHGYQAREDTPNQQRAETSLVQIRYVDGEQRGTLRVTEQQARKLQSDFQKQFDKDRIVTDLKLPDRPA